MIPTAALITLLEQTQSPVFDGRENVTGDSSPYYVVVDQNAPFGSDRYDGGSRKGADEWQVVCVARTRAGLRAAVEAARAVLLDQRMPSGFPLREVAAGPALAGGPEGDNRISSTLIYRSSRSRP